MNLTLKKKIAREILVAIVSLGISGLAFLIGSLFDNSLSEKDRKTNEELKILESQIDSTITSFRTIPIVDSLYKIQFEFSSNYAKAFSTDNSKFTNYWFWENVRRSIDVKTFNFTLANDEVVKLISNPSEDNSESRRASLYVLKNTLSENYCKRWNCSFNCWMPLDSIKHEFARLAHDVSFEKYLSNGAWEKYSRLRVRYSNLEQDKIHQNLSHNNYKLEWGGLTFLICVIVLFGLRYFYYLMKL